MKINCLFSAVESSTKRRHDHSCKTIDIKDNVPNKNSLLYEWTFKSLNPAIKW